MKELRRRQAEASGETVPDAGEDADSDGSDEDDADATSGRHDDDRSSNPSRPREPTPLRAARERARRPGGGSTPPRPPSRGPARPRGGDPQPRRRSGFRTVALVAIVVLVLLFLTVGVELWTDTLWYRSVGFGDVFW